MQLHDEGINPLTIGIEMKNWKMKAREMAGMADRVKGTRYRLDNGVHDLLGLMGVTKGFRF